MYMYVYIYIYTCVCLYLYRWRWRYIESERERVRERDAPSRLAYTISISRRDRRAPASGYEQALVCLSNREIVDASRGRTLLQHGE